MENTAPSMPIDVEKKAAPVVERKPIHSSFNNRSTRWMIKLDIQLAMTLCCLCMTAPLAIFALSINGFRPPLVAPRFDMLLSGAYVLNIMTLMLKCHCKAVLDESKGNFVASKHKITWRLPLDVIYDELWTRFQFFYVSWVVHHGSFLCLFCLALMSAGWLDLVWQLYRTLALAVTGTCTCLVLVQSGLAALSTPLSTHFLFKRPLIGLFVSTVSHIYNHKPCTPDALWLWEEMKQNKRARKTVNSELADWILGRSRWNPCMTEKGTKEYSNLRQIALANRSA